MKAYDGVRSLNPRQEKGESVMCVLRLSMTDEGYWIARVAFKNPLASGRKDAYTETLPVWSGDEAEVIRFIERVMLTTTGVVRLVMV